MPNDENKPSPLNIFMAFVSGITGDIDFQETFDIVENCKIEWEKENGNKDSFN